jgi:TolA-binding protein
LIASARLDVRPAPEEVRGGILVSLSTVGALGGGSAVAGATLGALRRLGLVKWIAATAILGTAGVGAYTTIKRAPSSTANADRAHDPGHASAGNQAPVAVPPTTEPSAPPASPAGEAPESDANALVPPGQHHRSAASKAASPDKGNASEMPSLESEVAALDRARARLAAGDPLRTLELLDEYDQAFPRGALRPEAAYLRIQALSKSGQREAARALAARFLARHPKSPHAAQLQALLSP